MTKKSRILILIMCTFLLGGAVLSACGRRRTPEPPPEQGKPSTPTPSTKEPSLKSGDYFEFNYRLDEDVIIAIDFCGNELRSLYKDYVFVPESNYVVGQESITIKKEYLKKLDLTEHEFTLLTTSGELSFSIQVLYPPKEIPQFQTVRTLDKIWIRDPYIFIDPRTDVAYLIQANTSGKNVRIIASRSNNLVDWSNGDKVLLSIENKTDGDPVAFWAPELHYYQNKYYFFVTYNFSVASGKPRQTAILSSDEIDGGYEFLGYMTDPDRWCLDGTLYIEDGIPYGIYCDEWNTAQDEDGLMKYYQLSEDLSTTIGEAKLMFRASDNEITKGAIKVTDGCFMFRNSEGELFMIWSTFTKTQGGEAYVLTYAKSDNGRIDGNWIQATSDEALYTADGGHGMIFQKNGKNYVVFHTPNGNNWQQTNPNSPTIFEHPVIYELDDTTVKGKLILRTASI